MRLDLSENAKRVLEARYLEKDEDAQVIETPGEMFERVARHVAAAEKVFDWKTKPGAYEERYLDLMTSLSFLPNSPTLMNAGRRLGQLSACFVLPVEDNLESIFETLKYTALIHKSGGGTGFSFSRVRPKNDVVATTSGIASGPVAFMRIFNTSTTIIKQGGTRRGANMGVLRVDHPDIEEFIQVKKDPSELQSFNLSAGMTDDFMKAIIKGGNHLLINPRSGKVAGKVHATELFDRIVQSAWESGEPGLLFLDRINRDNPTPSLGAIECTNPCGEQPLLPYESCNLGSINLVKMLCQGPAKPEIDWDKLRETVHLAVRFLDDVIEVNHFPIPEIERMTRANRKIGLGIMGFAHLLILMGIRYGSEESVRAAEEIMGFITREAHTASQSLAQERGAFPNFQISTLANKGGKPLRNASVTTIAPTGSLSIIAGCSSGIEPVFAAAYTRVTADGMELNELDPVYCTLLADQKPEAFNKELFVTALDLAPGKHVEIQAAFQRHTDNAVSKTINFPTHISAEEMKETLMLAHELGCKGITIYRDNSRACQVIRCGLNKPC